MINREIISAFAEIAREKNVDRSELSDIIETVFRKIIIKKYGSDENFDVIVNMDKGEIEIYQQKVIVEKVEDPVQEISLEDAQEVEPDLEVGDPYIEIINPASFGRRLITTAKQILNQQIMKLEKNVMFEEYEKKIGEIVIGDVHQIRRDAIFVNVGQAELKMPREEQIPRERYRRGESIKGIVKDAVMSNSGPEIIVSRADGSFLAKLFENEVPEIYDGTIEVKSIARQPGDRSKVIVASNDPRIDAVGACVGIKGSRIQAIVRELNNEKIDIINYSSEPEIVITRALSPAKPYMLEIDEEKKSALAIFEDDDISVAIGKAGQNIRLASRVTGYSIDAIKRSDYEGSDEETLYLEDIDGIDEQDWKVLYSVGIETAEEFLSASMKELKSIPDFDEEKIEPLSDKIEKALEKMQRIKETKSQIEDKSTSEEADEESEKVEETQEPIMDHIPDETVLPGYDKDEEEDDDTENLLI
ncbi:MAG: transcription termination factor NusA [Fidelibacterota bacterium]